MDGDKVLGLGDVAYWSAYALDQVVTAQPLIVGLAAVGAAVYVSARLRGWDEGLPPMLDEDVVLVPVEVWES